MTSLRSFAGAKDQLQALAGRSRASTDCLGREILFAEREWMARRLTLSDRISKGVHETMQTDAYAQHDSIIAVCSMLCIA